MANATQAPSPMGMTANDKLKNSFNDWFWWGLSLAAVVHFLLIAFWPDIEAADVSIQSEELEQIEVVQEFEIPPPPEQIRRPAVPVLSTNLDIAEDITIAEVTFDENPVSELPPPPSGSGVDVSEQPVFTPYEVSPELRNASEYARALTRRYPPMLRDAGIGGTVRLWVFIDENGNVQNTRIDGSSGQEALDKVAEEVVREVAQFSPALNRDQRVPVWVQIPVTFQTN